MACKSDSLPGQLIEMGCDKLLLAIAGQVTVAQVISQDIYDVGRCRRFGFIALVRLTGLKQCSQAKH
jgi:hypothetical protein